MRWWCHPTISSSVALFFSCPQFFPVSTSFPMSQLFLHDKRDRNIMSAVETRRLVKRRPSFSLRALGICPPQACSLLSGTDPPLQPMTRARLQVKLRGTTEKGCSAQLKQGRSTVPFWPASPAHYCWDGGKGSRAHGVQPCTQGLRGSFS